MAECPSNAPYECPDWCSGCDTMPWPSGCSHCIQQAGCWDPSAENYNEGCDPDLGCIGCPDDDGQPDTNDGSCCTYPSVGCTDPGAINYDDDAGVHCGDIPNSCCEYNCQYNSDCSQYDYCDTDEEPYICVPNDQVVGCTDPTANNFCANCWVDLNDECIYNNQWDNQGKYATRASEVTAQGYSSLQNTIYTEFDSVPWTSPLYFAEPENSTTTDIQFETYEDTSTKCDFSVMVTGQEDGGNINQSPTLIVEFQEHTSYMPTEGFYDTGDIFGGEVSYLKPIEHTGGGDAETGHDINYGPFDSPTVDYSDNSIVHFQYNPLANWYGEQYVMAKVRDIAGDMLLRDFSVWNVGDSCNTQQTPANPAKAWNITNTAHQNFNITVWLGDAEGGYTFSISHQDNPGVYIDLGIPNENNYHKNDYDIKPYTFEINDNILAQINSHALNTTPAQLAGTWQLQQYNHAGNCDGIAGKAIYAYQVSDADYETEWREINTIVYPVPDGYDFFNNEKVNNNWTQEGTTEPLEYLADEDLYLPAYRPEDTVDFTAFSKQFCEGQDGVLTPVSCEHKYLQQIDTAIQHYDGGWPSGQFIPNGESNALVFNYFHNQEPTTDKIHLTITLKNIAAGRVSLNGIQANQIIDRSFAYENNILYSDMQGNMHTQTLTWDLTDENGNPILLEGNNLLRIWDIDEGAETYEACEGCVEGPFGSIYQCCEDLFQEGTTEECIAQQVAMGIDEAEAWDTVCCNQACGGDCTQCRDYNHSGAELIKYTLWQENNSVCPAGSVCKEFGTIKDVDVVPNLTDAQGYSTAHKLKCIDNLLCNDDENITLTKLGMIHYNYFLRFNEDKLENILYPNERIQGVLVQGSNTDYLQLYDLWEENPEREFLIQGFRDADNQCCTAYGDYPDFDCIESLQTRFRINDIGLHLNDFIINGNFDNIEWEQSEFLTKRANGDFNSHGYSYQQNWTYGNTGITVDNKLSTEHQDSVGAYGWKTYNDFNCSAGSANSNYYCGTVGIGYHSTIINDDSICLTDHCLKLPDLNTHYSVPNPDWTPENQGYGSNHYEWDDTTQMYKVFNVHRWLAGYRTITENIELDFGEDLFVPGQLITVSVWMKTVPNEDTIFDTPKKKGWLGLYHSYRTTPCYEDGVGCDGTNNASFYEEGWGQNDLNDPMGTKINPDTGQPYPTRANQTVEPNSDWNIWERRHFTFEIPGLNEDFVDEAGVPLGDWDTSQRLRLYLYGHNSSDYGTIYYDLPSVVLGPEPGFSFGEKVDRPLSEKYYYNHFAMDVNILNSPLQFCEGDKILKNPALGFGSQAYDAMISPQPVIAEIPTRLSRDIVIDGQHFPPGISPDTFDVNGPTPTGTDHWPGGAKHQNFGMIEGLILETSPLNEGYVGSMYQCGHFDAGEMNILGHQYDWDDADNDNYFLCPTITDTTAGLQQFFTNNGQDTWSWKWNPWPSTDVGARNGLLANFLMNLDHSSLNASLGTVPAHTGNIDASIQQVTQNAIGVPYWVVPFAYKGQYSDNSQFVLSTFVFDSSTDAILGQSPGCHYDYTSPAPRHEKRNSTTGEGTGTTIRPMLSGIWSEIDDEYFKSIHNSGTTTKYKPVDERINFGVQMAQFSHNDMRIKSEVDGGGAVNIWNDTSVCNAPGVFGDTHYQIHSMASCLLQGDGTSECCISDDAPDEHAGGNYVYDKLPSWKNLTYGDSTIYDFDGQTCQMTTGGVRFVQPFITPNPIIGPEIYNDGYNDTWQYHTQTYYVYGQGRVWLGDMGNSQGVIDIKTTGYYHAPLPITLKYAKDVSDHIVDISPQPIDNPQDFPGDEPFEVVISVEDRSDILSTLWQDTLKVYPQDSTTYKNYLIDQLNLSNTANPAVSELYQTVEYNFEITARPTMRHKFSKKYYDVAYDGVTRVLPYFKEGLPFYVDNVQEGNALLAYDLVKHMGLSQDFENQNVEYYSTFKRNIQIVDANPPKLVSIDYIDEHHTQTGVQLGSLITYNNIDVNLIDASYMTENQVGTQALGSIIFNSYELGENNAIPAYVTVQDTEGNLTNISQVFTIEEENIAHRVADAINTGYEGFQTHQATVIDNLSSDTEGSNLQTVEVKSLTRGKIGNTSLIWSVQNDQVQNQPEFNNLVNGEDIIAIDVYEDFNFIDLKVTAGDIDPQTGLSFQIDTSNEFIYSGSIQSVTHINEPFENTGDTEYQQGDNTVNNSEGEARAEAVLRISSYPNQTLDTSTIAEYTAEELNNPDIIFPMIDLQPHYNGALDFVVRAVDNTAMFDQIKFRLIVHPVNDPPMFEVTGDKDIYMNNPNYPTSLSIPIRTNDIEEGYGAPVVNEVSQVTQTYCDIIASQVEAIQNATGFNPETEEAVYDCSDRNHCRWYCLPYDSTLQCDSADFNNDNIINSDDVTACEDAIPENNVNLSTIQLSKIPFFVDPNSPGVDGLTYQNKLDSETDDLIEDLDFVNIIPEYNAIGNAVFRVKATDYGFNEAYEIDEVRSGFSTASINIKELSQDGPSGDIFNISYASLGIKPDTYLYTAQGDDNKETRPTEYVTDIQLIHARFHDLENTENFSNFNMDNPYSTHLDCGNLSYVDGTTGLPDPGFVGESGFCCSTIPVAESDVSEQWYNTYWNKNRTYYYEEDFNDAVEDYRKFVDRINTNPIDNICSFVVSEKTRGFNNNTYISSSNASGFKAPNSEINPLDYTKNYRLEIEDVVNSYDTAVLIQSSSGEDITELFDGFEDFGTGINEPWADKWNALAQEGWETSGSNNPDYGKKVFVSPTIDATLDAKRILEEGYVYRFHKPSVYLVTIFSEDSYGFIGKERQFVDARDLVKINQTLLEQYDPWQGINITGTEPVQNNIQHVENRDLDKRESLGLYYYDDLNYVDDWNIKYGNNYRGIEGNWTNSFPVEYYQGEVLNKLQFSEAFDNRFTRASVGTYFTDENNGIIFYQIMRLAFPDLTWPSMGSADFEEEVEEEIEAIAAEIKSELGKSGATIFSAWASGQIAEETLPMSIASLVDRIEDLLTEPLIPTSEEVYRLEEESVITSDQVYNNICAAVEEGDSTTLSCQTGQTIKKIVFDSYGLPVGDCGIYNVNSDCHCYPDTSTWIGKKSVTVTANDSLCGDPCSDVTKYRYVEVTCGFDRYDRWYKGGRSYGGDTQSNSDGIYILPNQVYAPNKQLQEIDEPDLGYFFGQEDPWSDYFGRYVCSLQPDDPTWTTYPYNNVNNMTFSYVKENRSWYFLEDTYTQSQSDCYIDMYTDLSGNPFNCTQTESPSNCTDVGDDSYEVSSGCYKCQCTTYDNYTEKQAFLNAGNNRSCSSRTIYTYSGFYDDGGEVVYDCCHHCYKYTCSENNTSFANPSATAASQACEAGCYQRYHNHPETGVEFTQEITEDNYETFATNGWIHPYHYYLGQNKLVENEDKRRIDRILSIHMRPWVNELPDNGTGNQIDSKYRNTPISSLINLTSDISGTPTGEEHIGGWDSDITTSNEVDANHIGYYNYGYSLQLPIIWEELKNGVSIWQNPIMHPEYDTVPLWGVEEINLDPTGATGETSIWYRFWIRVLHDELVNEYKYRISANSNATESAGVFIYGASLQDIQPYEHIQNPYQKTRFPGEIGIWDFVPDVDVRGIKSADGFKSVLTEYYDDKLQPGKYKETTAPITAQLYFYIRNSVDKTLFTPKDILQYPNKSLYVGFLDWGDGSKIEYDKEPFEVNESNVLKHTYTDSGIYEVTGEIFNVAKDTSDDVLGVGNFYTFKLKLNVNINKEIEGEFSVLGGEKYTFLPYQQTFPVIGGISDSSIYKKIIKRTLGFTDSSDGSYSINTKFTYIGDKMKTEQALATMDERFIGPTISAYTGSHPTQSGLSDDVTIEIYGGSDACEESASLFKCTSTGETFDSLYVCGNNCHDYEIAKDAPRGFYEGNVDTITGQLVSQGSTYTDVQGNVQTSTKIPKLINEGFDLNLGELGDYLGDVDIAQTRYFDKAIPMWQLLGFPCLDTLEESVINYLPSDVSNQPWIQFSEDYGTTLTPSNDMPIAFENQIPHSHFVHTPTTDTDLSIIPNLMYAFPVTPGSNLLGQQYTFSVYVRRPDDFNIDVPIEINIGTNGGLLSWQDSNGEFSDGMIWETTSLNVQDYWTRMSVTITLPTFNLNIGDIYEQYSHTDNHFVIWVSITDTNSNITDGYSVIAPQLEKGELRPFRLPNNPILAGECTDAPGGNPGSEKYFRNVIPEDYNFYEREGISINNFTGKVISIDESATQDWIGESQWGTPYYYPVVNKLNKFGEDLLTLQSGSNNLTKTPYGSIGRLWNGLEKVAVATRTELDGTSSLIDDCLFDLDYGAIGDAFLEDLSGNTNLGIFIGDYKVTFNTVTNKPKKATSFKNMVLGQIDERKAF